MTKEELVKSLKNVKIVLGNGSDLYCDLKTRYSDYFETKKNYYSRIKNTYEQFKRQCDISFEPEKLLFDIKTCFGNYPNFVKNLWDVLFCLSFSNNLNDVLWCDIEKRIHNSLTKKEKDGMKETNFSVIHWDEVNRLVGGYKYTSNTSAEELFAAMISNIICNNKNENGKYNFYEFLKEELIRFEFSFGQYIKDATNGGHLLKIRQERLLSRLCNIDEVVSIDTFNYSNFSGAPDNISVKHINGTCDNPIFGIDKCLEDIEDNTLSLEANNYVKTYRRMDLELIENNTIEQKEYENVIVFGHSLNKQDYSYFYPLLDKIRISDTTASSRFVIAYSIYNELKAEEIRKNLKQSVINLFATYEKEHLGSHDARLLDYLTTQDRIVFYEI